MAGSRSGGIIAATWAALLNYGEEGYVESSQKIFDTLAYIVKSIRSIPGLEVMGDPKVCIVAFKSEKFNVYTLADEMKKRGWLLSSLQYPTCVHLYITPMHTQSGIKERFVNDLAEAAKELLNDPSKPLVGGVSVFKGRWGSNFQLYRKFEFLTACTSCSNDLQEYFYKVKRTKSKDGTSLTLELNTKQYSTGCSR